MHIPFYIVDVFAEQKYAGNQLAVILDFQQTLTEQQMQAIALEMNYPETTFVLSDQPVDGGYPVRIFTPREEVPFAGHPTIGTGFIIQQELAGWKHNEIRLHLKVGAIPVKTQSEENGQKILWMNTLPPEFGRTLEPGPVAEVLGLKTMDLDSRFPVQIVSTGLPFPIVPVKNLAAIKKAKCNADTLLEMLSQPGDPKAILLFCPETEDPACQLHVRMFADYYGIPEDPATGSANSCLAGYLVRHRYFGNDSIDIRVEQGLEVFRPSRLYLKAAQQADTIDIHVGGRSVITANGKLI